MFGAGFIIGPVLGGALGDYGLRLPFMAAAILNAGNLLLALLTLPESRRPTGEKIDLATLNPLRPLRRAFSQKSLLPITAIFFTFRAAGEVYGVCWASAPPSWGHGVRLRGPGRHGFCHPQLDDLRHHARVRPGRHRRAGLAVAGHAASVR